VKDKNYNAFAERERDLNGSNSRLSFSKQYLKMMGLGFADNEP
jgi:hypothetical protein